VLVVLADTHRERGHGLVGRAREAVAAADRVLHAGDVTTASALAALEDATARLEAVHGNSDDAAVRDRLPAERTLQVGDCRLALTHRRGGGATGLAMFGRARDADLVVHGHTHSPAFEAGDPALLDPGSHTSPRGGRPTHAELSAAGGELEVTIRDREGGVVAEGRVKTGDGV
jgi:putative phosphoesterase